MKRAFIFSLLALLLALLLPLRGEGERGEPSPGAEQALSLGEAEAAERETSRDEGERLLLKRGEEVLELSMAEYLCMALAGEMPAEFEPEALKAQAVALRSYALRCRARPKAAHPRAHVCDDAGCCCAVAELSLMEEKWGDAAGEYLAKLRSAVSATDGQYLSYEGESILAMFHSCSYGATEAGSALQTRLPYLCSVESPETESEVRGIVSRVELSPEELRATVLRSFPTAELEGPPESWVGAVEASAGGRVGTMELGGMEISGLALRQLFGLRSTDFSLEWTGEHFLFTVLGYGHGLGMSQYGANTMAAAGADHRDILAHYYPGTELLQSP